jgi:hypothetical protein
MAMMICGRVSCKGLVGHLLHQVTLLHLGDAMNNLAISYRQVGRNQEALMLQEKTLQIRQTHLRQNDPQLGVTQYLCV